MFFYDKNEETDLDTEYRETTHKLESNSMWLPKKQQGQLSVNI